MTEQDRGEAEEEAGTCLLTSQYVQSAVGESPTHSGLWQAPTGLGIAAGVLLAPATTQKRTPATAIVAGLVLSAVGLLLLTQVGGAGGLIVVDSPPSSPLASARCPRWAPAWSSTPPDAGPDHPRQRRRRRYRHQMAVAIPSGVPIKATEATRETIAATAGQLPAGPASELLDAAREAFTSGLNVVANIGAIIFVALAVLTATALRDTGTTGETANVHDTAGRADATASDTHPEGIRA